MSDRETTAPASIEAAFDAWEGALAGLELQASQVLRATKQLRRAAREGALANAPAAQTALRDHVAKLNNTLAHDVETPAIDLDAAFRDGSVLAELAAAAAEANVTLVQRDGRITAFPVELRLDARAQGVRVGRALDKGVRPSALARRLKALGRASGRFNARAFLDRLLRAYQILARDWKAGEGPLISLAALHDVLTLLPAAAADYPMGAFLIDLLRLDREPDARSGRGHRFELGGSTGTKGEHRLTVFDEAGAQHDYFAIRFIPDPPHA